MKKSVTFIILVLSFLSGVVSAQVLNDPQVDYPGSSEKPLTQELISELYKLNNAGDVLAAWKLLSSQNDGYAYSAAKIFGDRTAVGKCVVEENWKIVVGEDVRQKLYHPYAQLYQRSYIEFLDTNHRYPNSLEIEILYRNADDALGLPQSVSVDLLFNAVPSDWGTRVFFDRLSSLVGVGNLVNDKHWYDYTKLGSARVVNDSIAAQNLDVAQAKAIFKKTAGRVAKCMLQILKPRAKGAQP